MKKRWFLTLVLLCIAVLVIFGARCLVVNSVQRSDLIVALAGDHNDLRYWHALGLLRAGYGQRMMVDAGLDRVYGRSLAEAAADFAARTGGQEASRISVCPITYDSTAAEAVNVSGCLARLAPPPRTCLIVTHDYHTRRALAIFRRRLPQCQWSVDGIHDPDMFGRPWWRHRAWAKTFLTEWQKLVWWELFERWKR
jgi:uncharacterized SAM-binding protein YcdF (DUF218 family)